MNRYLVILVFIALAPNAHAQDITPEMTEYIRKAQDPAAYLIDKFKTYDVIFLAEHHLIRQNLLFVQDMIPKLYKAGVYTVAMEFGAAEVQDKLDALITGKVYDEKAARDIMFTYNVTWGYQEYLDVYRAAWRWNQSLPAGARRFRILNLSYVFHWDKYDGQRTIEGMSKVFDKGTVDKYRADRIEQEILSKGEKVLALVGTPHAYTRYGSPYYKYNGDNFCDFDRNWLGNRVYRKSPGRVYSVMLHQAFTIKQGNMYSAVSPGGGLVEKLMATNNNRAVGFDLLNSPAGKIPDRSLYAVCYPDFTLEQLFDGYNFLKPLRELEGCTPIPEFVNETNIAHAISNFPDPDWHEKIINLEEMRKFIINNPKQAVRDYKGL